MSVLAKIGDVVQVKILNETEATLPLYLAAMIVKVWSAQVVNLKVFNDGEEADLGLLVSGKPCGFGADFKMTSVRYTSTDELLCWSERLAVESTKI